MPSVRSYLCILIRAAIAAADPTVFLAGDSTMAASGNHDGTAGWGAFLPDYISLAVNNQALAGRSARSFTRGGGFHTIANQVRSGDYVVIEFGHNDVGGPNNGRGDCPPVHGDFATTCHATYK